MVARPLRATPERVEKAIAELRREGKRVGWCDGMVHGTALIRDRVGGEQSRVRSLIIMATVAAGERVPLGEVEEARRILRGIAKDRKSTRLNSSHANISYAVFC